MLEPCELCRGLRGHGRLLQDLYEQLDAEYKRAMFEWRRLNSLFEDVCWYTFECKCKEWKEPWWPTLGDSRIELHGHRHAVHGRYEMTTFPVYYDGPVSDAPPLPVDIVLLELKQAHAYAINVKASLAAVYDYAPGGRKYEEVVREGAGARAYRELQIS